MERGRKAEDQSREQRDDRPETQHTPAQVHLRQSRNTSGNGLKQRPQTGEGRGDPGGPTDKRKQSDSASICPMMRSRLAPRAARTPISGRRPEARASSRFARFNATISTISGAAPIKTSNRAHSAGHPAMQRPERQRLQDQQVQRALGRSIVAANRLPPFSLLQEG